jgi:hypothetical protein
MQPVPASMTIPTEVVVNLIRFANRATLTRAEWQYLEKWDGDINAALEQERHAAPTPLPVDSGG